MLEFGTHHGYAFTKMLYAIKYLRMSDQVTAHAFDTFEGLPPAVDNADRSLISTQDLFFTGQFPGDYEALDAYCRRRYRNYALHKGLFEDSLTPELLRTFEVQLPILVWIDSDYYSSARTVIERLHPYLPSGCVVYFDEYELVNYGSRMTGEARVVHELNHGAFGQGIELVLDRWLSWDSERVYRFIRFEGGPQYERIVPYRHNPGRRPTGGSPLP
jgi:hypothetical protein